MEIRIIDGNHQKDILLKNDPFPIWGRLEVEYSNGRWSHRAAPFPQEEVTELCFPDEAYNYDAMSVDSVFIGAYEADTCIGLAIVQNQWNRYLYLMDLKVSAAYRGRGVGRMLIEACMQVAAERKYRGVSLIAQDNNLTACLFYLHTGFRIGGLNTQVYAGTSQEGKADIFFFRDLSYQRNS